MPEASGGPEGVTVSGSASVQVTPDVATAVLGAHVRAGDVQDALARAGEALGALRASLLRDGCAESDLRTEATNVWRDDGAGFRGADAAPSVTVRLTLRAVLRDVTTAGGIVQRALAAAGDAAQLDSLGFAVTDRGAATRQAREAAFADARATAEQYASLAGRPLGVVVEVEDGGGPPPSPRPLARAALAMDAALPVDAGEQTVPASVRVRWAWGD